MRRINREAGCVKGLTERVLLNAFFFCLGHLEARRCMVCAILFQERYYSKRPS